MPRKTDRSSGPNNGTVLMTAIVAALGVGAMGTYIARTPGAQKVAPDMRRPSPEPDKSPDTTPAVHRERRRSTGHGTTVDIKLPTLKDDVVSLSDKTTPSDDPVKDVTEAAMKVAGVDGFRLMSHQTRGGTIALDFNSALSEGVGSMQEGRFIDALTMGLRQVKGAQRFRLYAEGKPVDTLGHLDLGESVSLKEGEEPQP